MVLVEHRKKHKGPEKYKFGNGGNGSKRCLKLSSSKPMIQRKEYKYRGCVVLTHAQLYQHISASIRNALISWNGPLAGLFGQNHEAEIMEK